MFKFNVMPDGGDKFEVTATSRDIAKWEKTNKGVSFGGLQTNMRMVDLQRIAFNAAQRQGLFTGTLAEWEDGVDVDVLDSEDEADPTNPAA